MTFLKKFYSIRMHRDEGRMGARRGCTSARRALNGS